ncbi:hypothetical protein RDABS01_017977 [Bienertia sinuspersici]
MLIRFLNFKTRDNGLNIQHLLFDNYPSFLTEWEDGLNLDFLEITKVPVWVCFPKLPLKYRGCLEKLMSTIGKPIRADNATTCRDRISFTRLLVEMVIKGSFPEQLYFVNEHGVQIE